MKIKREIFTLLLLGCVLISWSTEKTEYIPFVQPGKVWSCFWSECADAGTYYRYRIGEEDTICSGKTYKKAYVYTEPEFNPATAFCFGGLREEDKKVYGWCDVFALPERTYIQLVRFFLNFAGESSMENEALLYDFSLEEGDRFTPLEWITMDVLKCDTVEICGALRKRMQIGGAGWFTRGYWIEGLGFQTGPFSQLDPSHGNQYLSSIQENGQRYYYGPVVPNDQFIGYPFAPVGTQWYYGTRNSTTDEENYLRYECTGTETIGGKQCLVIESDRVPRGYSVASKRYLYEDSCMLSLYLPESNQFTQLYNFNDVPSGTLDPDGKMYHWTVKDALGDVSVELYNKFWILLEKKLYLINYEYTYTAERAGKSLSQKSTIIENIGDMQNLFYTDQFDAKGKDVETFTGLRCFYHPDLGWYKWRTTECDYSSRSVARQEIQNFRINSQKGNLVVHDPNKAIYSIRLFTSEGKELFRLHSGEWDRPVPISYKGVLLYKAMLDNRLEVSGKLLVE